MDRLSNLSLGPVPLLRQHHAVRRAALELAEVLKSKPDRSDGPISDVPDTVIDSFSNIPNIESNAPVMPASEAAERYLWVMGRPFNLKDRPYLREILDNDAPEIHLQCGRQVGKSVSNASELITHSMSCPYYPHLYVTPRGEQASVFSSDVFNAICQQSPAIKPMISEETSWRIGMRQFKNGARTYFKSCFRSPDAIRGLTAGRIIYDERQDIVSDYIPIISECATNMPDRRFIFSGTPKSKSNFLSKDFYKSSACEWLVYCHACGQYIYQDTKIIGKYGYICSHCGKPIDILDGRWVAANPARWGVSNGFRITQMMNPNVSFEYVKNKIDKATDMVVHNEIFGLPYDEGSLVLSTEDIAGTCGEYLMAPRTGKKYDFPLYAGVDWGGGNPNVDTASYSVLTIGGFYKNVFCVVFMCRFEREEGDIYRQPPIIDRICRAFHVMRGIGDYGFGTINNRRMVNEYRWAPAKWMEASASNIDDYVRWSDRASRWMYNRTEAFVKTIDSIKNKRIRFPKFETMRPYVADFTNIFAEVDNRGKLTFDHNGPDDAFNSLFYAYMAATIEITGANRYAVENWTSGVNNPVPTNPRDVAY